MKKLIFFSLFSIYLFSFSIEYAPNIKERVNPASGKYTILSFNSSIEEAKKSVVNISTEKSVRRDSRMDNPYFRFYFNDPQNYFPQDRIERSLGSGVIVSSDGYIITNSHVINNADKIFVTLFDSNQEIEAKVIATDIKSDVAIIKISNNNLHAIKFANSKDLKVGDMVFAIGNSFGVGTSVTGGIISALNKSGMGLSVYENFIQTDSSINVGNSGGALIDSRGALVGINTAILSRSGGNDGIGFAIPSSMVEKIAQDLIKYGYVQRGYLGVTIGNVVNTKDSSQHVMVLVLGIEINSPADKIGLRKDDIIIKINNKKISSANDLTNKIGLLPPNSDVIIHWLRNGRIMSGGVKLSSLNKTRRF